MAQKSCILIVDDDYNFRLGLRDLLEIEGFDCKEADNGAVALEVLSQDKVDLVLTDRGMPVMNGFQLLDHMHSRNLTREIPVIMVTGDLGTDMHVQSRQAGVQALFNKPYNFCDLLDAIKKAICYPSS